MKNKSILRLCVLAASVLYAGWLSADDTYKVSVNATGCSNTRTDVYPAGAEITFRAQPASGFRFDRWSNGSTENPYTVRITQDTSLTALFAELPPEPPTPQEPDPVILPVPTWHLVIGSNTCTQVSEADYPQGSTFTFSAKPKSGWLFRQWSDGVTDNPRTLTLTQDSVLTAVFDLLPTTEHHAVINATGCGESMEGDYLHRTEITLNAVPENGYRFARWSDNVTDNPRTIVLTRDTVLTASFEAALNTYTLAVSAGAHGSVNDEVNGDNYEAGTSVTVTATANTFYHFVRWTDDNNEGAEVSTDASFTFNINANTSLTAVFEMDAVIELEDNHKADDLWWTDYANLVTSLGDTKKDVRYLRDLPAGKWCVFALPFDYSFRSGNTLKGGVYEMYRADYTDDGQLFLYFAPVTTKIRANRPYLYRSSTGDSKPLFAEVQLQAVADGSYSVDNTNTTVGGAVTIHNTTAAMLLAKDKSVIYLDNNRLYYPNLNPGTDTWMRAFRGYFTLDGMSIRHIAPRVRIVVEGETVTELEVVSEDGAEADTAVRKYMENGILVIERNGVRYDATGARLN